MPLQRLDPLTKGSLFHRVQSGVPAHACATSGRLPLTAATLDAALDDARRRRSSRVADDERARLAPAIRRVWDDEIAAMQRDLVRWLQLMAEDPDGWVPQWFELAFGLPGDEGRDAASLPDPVTRRRPLHPPRLDGHGRAPSRRRAARDGSQDGPRALARADDRRRRRGAAAGALRPGARGGHRRSTCIDGRLWFCTAAGEFSDIEVPITETTRRIGLEVLEIVDRGIEHGVLAPYPKAGACEWCDFTAVCGADEERRTGPKARRPLSRSRRAARAKS